MKHDYVPEEAEKWDETKAALKQRMWFQTPFQPKLWGYTTRQAR